MSEVKVYKNNKTGEFYKQINCEFNLKCWFSGKRLNHLISLDNPKIDFLLDERDLEKEFEIIKTY